MFSILSVLLAAIASFAVGAFWYGVFAKPWMADVGLKAGPDGKPQGGMNPVIYVVSFVLQILVAGMMRHVFAASGIAGLFESLVAGAAIGLFFITPWIAMNNLYGKRPIRLSLIDGGYAVAGCAAMGGVLSFFLWSAA